MVINERNSYINTFSAGMNSDTAYDTLDNKHYVYGKNVRITKNQLLGGYTEYSTLHEGIVTPIPAGVDAGQIEYKGKILSVDSVDRMFVITTAEDKTLRVYRGHMKEDDSVDEDDFKKLWDGEVFKDTVPDKISTVLYKELENVTKLYIATGETPLMIIRVDDESTDTLYQNIDGENVYTPVDCLINNRIIPQNRVFIDNIISGRLKTQQVQYTYRLYNKYANTTQLAPLTNKIQVIDPSRSKENGNAEDTETSIGFTLKIEREEDYWKYFKRIQVYRLSYIKPGEQAEVSLIYDDELPKNEEEDFILNDIGIEPLQTLTIEEFGAMSGLILVPQVVEQNQNYMFCGNVKDDTIIRDVKITPIKNGIKSVKADVTISLGYDGVVPNPEGGSFVDTTDINYTNYFKLRGVNPSLAKSTYNNIITSSLLRSLRRGETYRYAIVLYDKYGRRTDVCELDDIDVEPIGVTSDKMPFTIEGNNVVAHPIGAKITLPKVEGDSAKDIIGCQIVRRSSSDIYQKTLLQVALARPVNQGLFTIDIKGEVPETPIKYSPYYPSGFLGVNDLTISPTYYYMLQGNYDGNLINDTDYNYIAYTDTWQNCWAKTRATDLFQIFSSEIDYRRDDVLSRLTTSDANMEEVYYIPAQYKLYNGDTEKDKFYGLYGDTEPWGSARPPIDGSLAGLHIKRYNVKPLTTDEKNNQYWVFNYFKPSDNESLRRSNFVEMSIKAIKDVRIPNWEDGFSNIQRDSEQEIISAVKKYKQFTTAIGSYTYNNWCSFGKYDLRSGKEALSNVATGALNIAAELLDTPEHYDLWINGENQAVLPFISDDAKREAPVRFGYIGPGGSCFLVTTENSEITPFLTYTSTFYTSICNITHPIKQDDVESDEQVMYYGFGNYFKVKVEDGLLKTDDDSEQDDSSEVVVFDGDIYITPHELTTMYKTYNFESVDTLQSTLITNYVPLESKVNTFFDYGMNLRNTNSANLMNEPGSIDGVATQDRPAHQYNMIYSDNDVSNDVFTLISTDKNETNLFKQRAYFSEPKTNGEFIDNFPIFKAASFIDVDSQYGQITNMDTDRNNLYYWQDSAFGKFSVNERSLINDTNGNTIMLGQAGILSRYDYLSTKYGMRLHDLCSRTTENGLFWVDINNKAVVALGENGAVNYGEQLFVQNIINNSISDNVPYVDYDIQNNELLCKCLSDGEQLVFNTKYNIATSVYTRKYDNMIYIKNHLYSIYKPKDSLIAYIDKLNYTSGDNKYLLHPSILLFVVNPSTSITKVFDSQQVVPITRYNVLPVDFDNIKMSFETDLYKKTSVEMEDSYTDREGNIIYNIPRFDQKEYGNRMRGKWMKVNMEAPNLSEYAGLSHVITKFRQSFS